MKNRYTINRFLQIIVCFFLVFQAKAQTYYPVSARITQQPPYAVYLADYANAAQKNFSIQIQQNDQSFEAVPIKLRIFIEGQGYSIKSRDVIIGEPSMTLALGEIYNVPEQQVANYFKQYNLQISPDQYGKALPEGTVRFGIQVLEYNTGRAISGVQWAPPVWIKLNEPPVWVLPINETKIEAAPIHNTVFQWSPRHNNATDVEYEFTIKELIFNSSLRGNIQNLYLSQPDFFSKRTTSNTLVYDATMPPLVEGRVYAYRVRAVSKVAGQEMGTFRNNGFSEIQYFTYGEPMLPMKAPSDVKAKRNFVENSIKVDWIGQENHKRFLVAYRIEGSNAPWTVTPVEPFLDNLFNTFTIRGVQANQKYEIRVGAEDKYNQQAYSKEVVVDGFLDEYKILSWKGNTKWAFYDSEENFVTKDRSWANLSGRDSSIFNAIKLSNAHKILAGAKVTIVENDASIFNAGNKKNYKLVHSVYSDEKGNFEFSREYLSLIDPSKKYRVIIEHEGMITHEETLEIKESKTYVLGAQTLRYKLQLVKHNLGDVYPDFEEIGLYRIRSLRNQFPILNEEGNGKSLIYNGAEYVQVADLLENTTATKLFSNTRFNDFFVLKIKSKYRKELVIPVKSLSDLDEKALSQYLDKIKYQVPTAHIFGVITKGGKPLANSHVTFERGTYKTDSKGFYQIPISRSLQANQKVSLSVADPSNLGFKMAKDTLYTLADIELNLDLPTEIHYVEGFIQDKEGNPVVGARVSYKNQILNTNTEGWFHFIAQKSEMTDEVLIQYNGYQDLKVSARDFTSKNISGESDFVSWVKSTSHSDKAYFYDLNVNQGGYALQKAYRNESIRLERLYNYRILAYESHQIDTLGNIKKFTKINARINDKSVEIGSGSAQLVNEKYIATGGYIGKTTEEFLDIKIQFDESNLFLDQAVKFADFDPRNPGDTVLVLLAVQPAYKFHGIVRDGTNNDTGVSGIIFKDSDFPIITDAKISINNEKTLYSDNQGRFSLIVPREINSLLRVYKDDFEEYSLELTKDNAKQFTSQAKEKSLFLVKRDTNQAPNFARLLGFKIELESSKYSETRDGRRLYIISGKLPLNQPGVDNIYTGGETEELTFKDIQVWVDAKDKENAIPFLDEIDFIETEADIKLFGYASMTMSANPLGKAHIRLQNSSGLGIIGGSRILFNVTSFFGVNFGEMQLVESTSTDQGFNIFRADNKDTVKVTQRTQTPAVTPTTVNKQPITPTETDPERKGLWIERERNEADSAWQHEDAFMMAFASKSIKELGKDKSYKIRFLSTATKADTAAKLKLDTAYTYISKSLDPLGVDFSALKVSYHIVRENAVLDKNGVKLNGYLVLPKLWRSQMPRPLKFKTLDLDTKFNIRKAILQPQDSLGRETHIFKFGVDSTWMVKVNTFQFYNNFSGFGLGGIIQKDSLNKLVINEFGLSVQNKSVYPNIAVSTTKEGIVFKRMTFTTLPNKVISFRRDLVDNAYEVEAALRMTYKGPPGDTTSTNKILGKVFPLELQLFQWSTSGKLVVAIKGDLAVEVGPVTVKVRRLLFTKGAALKLDKINSLLSMSEQEAAIFSKTVNYNRALQPDSVRFKNWKDSLSTTMQNADSLSLAQLNEIRRVQNSFSSSDDSFLEQLDYEISVKSPAAKWAFGFAGGVEITSVSKGLNFDSDFGFVVGEFDDGFKFQINEIMLKLETAGFKAMGRVKISTSGAKVGFEGGVDVEAAKLKLAAGFKFYRLYENDKSVGIELGANLRVSTMIAVGPVTFLSLGGGFDLNTQTGKYFFKFVGDATSTGTPKEVVFLKDIYVSLLFETKLCDGLPVIKGGLEAWVNNELLCKADVELDMCKVRFTLKVNCEKSLLRLSNVKINALLIGSKDGFFGGAQIRAYVLGREVNANLLIGGELNTKSKNLPSEFNSYVVLLKPYILKSDKTTFSGFYIDFQMKQTINFKGGLSIGGLDLVSFELATIIDGKLSLGVNFANGNFRSENYLYISNKVEVSVIGIGIGGKLSVYVNLNGGYSDTYGWELAASAGARFEIYTKSASDWNCNKFGLTYSTIKIPYPCGLKKWFKIKWCHKKINIPTGLGLKVCISGSLSVSYRERGTAKGWRVKI